MVDARDGRVLLQRVLKHGDFAVCDPLFRRYVLLPKIPQNSAALGKPQGNRYFAEFLVPASAGEAETSFRVIYMENCSPEPVVAFVFSSSSGQWSRLATGLGMPPSCMYSPCYAYGCFYWKLTWHRRDKMRVLNTRSMEFSTIGIPSGSVPRYIHQDFVIVQAGEGRIGVFTLHSSIVSTAASYLGYAIGEINDDCNIKWQSAERTVITFPSQHPYRFVGATDRYMLLGAFASDLHSSSWREESKLDIAYFSVELESMQIERVCSSMGHVYAKPYTGFPPSLCLPSICSRIPGG